PPASASIWDNVFPLTFSLPIARQFALPLALFVASGPASWAQSRWAHFGPDGKLVYARTSRGDRIPDFSSAGYRGGGVAHPTVLTRVRIAPTNTPDDTPTLQAAIDQLATLPPDTNGHRGAVELAPGTFHLMGTLHITASGVVLRGSGAAGDHPTILQMSGPPRMAIGWSVLWNNEAGSIIVQDPPGGAHWSIGDKGEQKTVPMPTPGQGKGLPLPEGTVDSPGNVQPASLYLEQLRERLGPAAVAAIGYQ
ncbi:MAG: hypothetical protein WA476_02190, partial [Acidobacteriaceae bacterium]